MANNIDISNLLPHQKQRLLDFYNSILTNSKINPISLSKNNSCPKCSSTKYVKNGMRGDKQRYKCSNCNHSFTSTSNTSIHNIKKTDTWTDFICIMLESKVPPTLKELSQKLYISTKTAHVWKHKFLASLNKLDDISLRGQVEMDEVFLPFCVKGKRGKEKTTQIKLKEKESKKKNTIFLCVHNRNNDFDFLPIKIQQRGNIKAEDLANVIDKLNINPNTIVITDKSKASTKYFKTRDDIQHETFISSGEKTSVLHNNNINNVMSLYKTWCKRFKGYSTKYIWNYLKWFRFHKKFMEYNDLENMVGRSIKDISSFIRYRRIPEYYSDFLFSS
jgi:transposase-like protein